MRWIDHFRRWANVAKRDVMALWLAARDPRVPWYAKGLAAAVAAYALSPIDLIPDFIPVLGYLDDLIIVPIGIILVVRMVPPEVMSDLRVKAKTVIANRLAGRIAAFAIGTLWLGALSYALFWWLAV